VCEVRYAARTWGSFALPSVEVHLGVEQPLVRVVVNGAVQVDYRLTGRGPAERCRWLAFDAGRSPGRAVSVIEVIEAGMRDRDVERQALLWTREVALAIHERGYVEGDEGLVAQANTLRRQLVRARDPKRVPLRAVQERYLDLAAAGAITAWEMARRMGWTRRVRGDDGEVRREPDHATALRRMGLKPAMNRHTGRWEFQTVATTASVLAMARALGLDPSAAMV